MIHFIDLAHWSVVIMLLSLLVGSIVSWSVIFSIIIDMITIKKTIEEQYILLHYCQNSQWIQWHEKLALQKQCTFFMKLYKRVQYVLGSADVYSQTVYHNLQEYLALMVKEKEEKTLIGLSYLIMIVTSSLCFSFFGVFAIFLKRIVFAQANNYLLLNELGAVLIESVYIILAGFIVAIPAYLAYNILKFFCKKQTQELARQGEYLLLHLDNSFKIETVKN
jgi:hypothetical protein